MPVEANTTLKLRVEGMDCAACAVKIENGLKRLPGVSEINVNYGLERLSLVFDEDRTSRGAVEGRIRSLGYTPLSMPGEPSDGANASPLRPETAGRVWWRTRKGQLVIATGVLLGLAFLVATVAPAMAEWAYLATALLGVLPILRRAIAGARHGTPFSIETLMSVAAIGAVAIGESAEAAIVVFLFAVGEILENVAAGRARAGIEALMNLVPRVARRERAGVVTEVPADELALDDVVVVRPGDRVPSDGEVIEGSSELDEAPVTGESVPVLKEVGSTVYAGSINANGVLKVRITHTAADNTIARIIHLVEEAQGSKAPTARFIDRFSAYYTPAAMAVSALIIVAPPLLLGADWGTWIYRGLATLLIACPCALVISTPAAIASGLAAGARLGLLIKGGAALETLGKVATVAFDKTGTLTVGKPRVTDIIPLEGDEAGLLAKAAAVEDGSSHPLGMAIVETAEERGLELPKVFGGAMAIPGKAVTARLREGFVSVGSPRYAAEQNDLSPELSGKLEALEAGGKTAVIVLSGKRPIGVIALRDEPREDAASGVARLKALGIRAVMLTGDNRRTADAIASGLGLEAKAELLPDAKLSEIAALREHGGIAMVGDGINDAPALAASSVGIAMGGGTDVALETADAALLKNRVTGVAEMVGLSRATLGNIWQNIALALGLKAVFLVTTLTGTTTLWMAILADTGATVLVTINALRLLRFRGDRETPAAAVEESVGYADSSPAIGDETEGHPARG
ncbi:heavy metal translocating P-type ATPase [Martelella mediterranea]|uniref:P-type Zn(2+) transporter n=2 Tax=Martelella mediterranea TaxID=293089 RepID=A0A4R3NLA3_9HYPH|nr:heavy metal translocating P-type ATPase [Martelella mediterranea]AQZ54273.1 Lead, cadmium, zinc and mercury-transporting ATPase [Martelella mediterranea DSM 17316]TCT36027.1 Cd2+/Zn2+-exporting ATPase [Martelella mediterranea]